MCRDRLAGIMQYVVEHPEEMSKVKGLQRQVKEVQTIMENNIQIVRPRKLSRMAVLHAEQPQPQPPASWLAEAC